MTNSTMPERIYAWGAGDLPRWSEANVYDGAVEYVSADLVQGDANEPLAEGQYRWAKRYKIKCIWVMTFVKIGADGTPYLIAQNGLARKASSYAVIGSVLRPPEDA